MLLAKKKMFIIKGFVGVYVTNTSIIYLKIQRKKTKQKTKTKTNNKMVKVILEGNLKMLQHKPFYRWYNRYYF